MVAAAPSVARGDGDNPGRGTDESLLGRHRRPALDDPTGEPAESTDSPGRHPRETFAATATALACLLLWGYALRSIHPDPAQMDGLGLLGQLPWTWYGAAAVGSVALLAYAVRGRAAAWALALLHLAVTAVLFGTTAVTYPWPRYAWTYKHLGVTEYLLAGHPLDRSLDIYQNWPGFFYVGAALTWLTGIDPMTMARWAEPFFATVFGVCVAYAVGALTRDRRIRWGAVAVYLLANWIGQGYYAPQALAICLQLVFFGAVLRGPIGREPRAWLARVLDRFGWRIPGDNGSAATDHANTAATHEAGPAATLGPGLLAVASFAALATTHQLTPVATLMQLAALVACFRVRAWWVILAAPVIEAAWLATAWTYLSGHVTLLSLDFFDNVQTPTAEGYPALSWMTLTGYGARVTTVVVAAVAAAGMISRLRRRVPDPALFALALAPVLILAMNGYGAEGMLRVYVYALPWLAAFAAYALVGARPSFAPRPARTALAVLIAPLIFGPCLVASFAQERAHYLSGDDVAAARWFEQNTPPGSYAVYYNGNFPARSTAHYAEHGAPDGTYTPNILAEIGPGGTPEHVRIGAQDVIERIEPQRGYVIVSPSQKLVATMWGQLPADDYDRAVLLLETSTRFRVIHRDGDAVVLKYLGDPR